MLLPSYFKTLGEGPAREKKHRKIPQVGSIQGPYILTSQSTDSDTNQHTSLSLPFSLSLSLPPLLPLPLPLSLSHPSIQVFFVVLLQPPSVCNSPMGSTTDPDPLIPCDLMDGRDAFLTMAREKHWEFSSLRRAKASTQAMLYELHNQGSNFIYSCNGCGRSVETRYHCRECDVSGREGREGG